MVQKNEYPVLLLG